MANAQVEKLKSVGLRHGEKALVGVTAAVCVLFLFWAATKPTIEITPEQISKDAEVAQSHLSQKQEQAEIVESLESQGIKNPAFVKLVEAQESNLLKPSDFKVARSWITPEPGAGLIRDKPALVVPAELLAYPGRGGASLFQLDPVTKKRVPEDPNEKTAADDTTKARRKTKRRRGGSSSMYMASSMMPGSAAPAELTEEQKKQAARDEEKRQRLFARTGKAAPAEEKTEAAPAEEGGPFKEETRGLRWVAITGTIDHKKLVDNYRTALKNTTAAPNYKQLDVERQVKQSDGSWSDWEPVDAEKNHEIIYNLPEEEEEMTPETVRIGTLVDPLPFLKAGFWEQVHVASLVPKEKLEAKVTPPVGSMMSGPNYMPPSSSSMTSGPMSGSMMMSGPGSSSMMGMGMGPANADAITFQTTEEPTIMIRSLDFTVEPDISYRYRLRIVVFNPNFNREDVSPGTDTKSLTLEGDWSEPTNEVTMPDDITTYAMHKVLFSTNAKRNDEVTYQIVKWNPDNGVTVARTMHYAPGQIVGEPISTPMPVSDGSGVKNEKIDYNSHQLMLDQTGGMQSLSPIVNAKLDVPGITLLIRPDGSVVVRNVAFDATDPVRKDMAANYDREVKESSKPRSNSNGMSSMMMYGSPGSGAR